LDDKLSEILLKSLIDGGISEIVRKSSEYLKSPVMVVDSEYNCLSCHPNEKIDDPLWDAIIEFKTAPPSFVNLLNAEKMMPLGVEEVAPYFLNRGFLKDHPRLLVNLIVNNKCFGYLTVLCENYTPKLLNACKLIGDTISIEFQRKGTGSYASADYQTMFLNNLFDEKITNASQLANWLEYIDAPLTCPFSVCCALPTLKYESPYKMTMIQRIIKKTYPGLAVIIKNGTLVFLMTEVKSDEKVISFVKTMNNLLNDFKLRFGISNLFDELEKTPMFFKQSMYALSMSKPGINPVIAYKDCIMNRIVSVICSKLPKESYSHQAIQNIRLYDKENSTEYLKTLEIYLKSMCNTTKTVTALHIHRNTLPHRLEMIEKIGKIDLTDINTCTLLLLNFYIESSNKI